MDRLSVHEFVRMDLPVPEFLNACAAAGVRRVALLRACVEAFGLQRAAWAVRDAGLGVSSYSAAGWWASGFDPDGERWTLDDNLRRLDAAAELGAALVVVAGGPPARGRGGLGEARRRVAEGLAELWPHAAERGLRLALEPLHPLFCPDRSVVTSLRLALDLVEACPAERVGIALDCYHVWWDADLEAQVRRARSRVFAVQLSDWVLPLPPGRRRRGLPGEGCIDLDGFLRLTDEVGYRGPHEVEVQNEELSALPPGEAVRRIVESYRSLLT